MQITVSADGDLLIPRELVDRLSAHAGDECYAELNSTGTIISVSRMVPGIARAYGTLQAEGDTDQIVDELRGH